MVTRWLRTGSHKINLLDILTTAPHTSIAIVTFCSATKRKQSLFSTPSDNTKQSAVLSWIFQCRKVSKGRPEVCISSKARRVQGLCSLSHLPIYSFSRPSKSYFTAACAASPKCPCWRPRWILGNSLVTSACKSANAYLMYFFFFISVESSSPTGKISHPPHYLQVKTRQKLLIKYAWACMSSVITFRIV